MPAAPGCDSRRRASLEQRQHFIARAAAPDRQSASRRQIPERPAQHIHVSSSRMKGGSSRRMLGSLAVPARDAALQKIRCSAFAGRVVRSPMSSPAPWCPVTGPTTQVLADVVADALHALEQLFALDRISTASIAAHASGPPPKVVPRESALSDADNHRRHHQRRAREAVAERLGGREHVGRTP